MSSVDNTNGAAAERQRPSVATSCLSEATTLAIATTPPSSIAPREDKDAEKITGEVRLSSETNRTTTWPPPPPSTASPQLSIPYPDTLPGDGNDKPERTAATEVVGEDEDDDDADMPPVSRSRAWMVLAGSFLSLSPSLGFNNSCGVIQSYVQKHQLRAFTVQEVSWIPNLGVFLCLFMGVQVGPLFDRHGHRALLVAGSVMLVLATLAMSLVPEDEGRTALSPGAVYGLLVALWAVIDGTASAMIAIVSISIVGQWFRRRKGLATGVALLGSSMGGAMIPLVLRRTFGGLGWGWSMRIVALIMAVQLIGGNLLMRGRPGKARGKGKVNLKCLLEPRFAWVGVGCVFYQFVQVGSLGVLPAWSLARGFNTEVTFHVVAIINGTSGIGRLTAGYLSDHFGRFNMAVISLCWSSLTLFLVGTQLHPGFVGLFYLFAVMMGLGSGALICMMPLCVHQMSEERYYGRNLGTIYCVLSFSALGSMPLSAKMLHDLGTQVFLYVYGACFAVAIVAFVMARYCHLGNKWRFKVVV